MVTTIEPPVPAAVPAVSPAVTRAIARLDADAAAGRRTALQTLCTTVGVSRAHLLRLFASEVGCTPAQWQRARRAARLQASLTPDAPVSTAAFNAGFESLPSAYAAVTGQFGVAPGALKRGAPGETVRYTIVPCALGQVLVAMTTRGICRVVLGDDSTALARTLREELHAATLERDDDALRALAGPVVAAASGAALVRPLPLDLRGTAFQQRVWRELQRIPRGETITYGQLAQRIGAPGAVRAVGTACGANPAALVVPCHRVVRGDGALGGYRWGLARKARLLETEQQAATNDNGGDA